MPDQAIHYPKSSSLSSRALEWLQYFFEPPPRLSPFQEERRHLPRQPLQLEICVTSQSLRILQGRTQNISHNGLFIQFDAAPPPPGSILRLHFGNGPLSTPFEELVGVVTRTHTHRTCGIGVEIIEGITPPKALKRFHNLLSHHRVAA